MMALCRICLSWFVVSQSCIDNHVDSNTQVELKLKYKYRLILDESISFGSVGRTGRGLTELYNVPVSTLLTLTGRVLQDRHPGLTSGHAHRLSRYRA